MKCANENCSKDADTLDKVLLTCDGDFACSEKCAMAWRKQRDHFLNNVLPDDVAYNDWMKGYSFSLDIKFRIDYP